VIIVASSIGKRNDKPMAGKVPCKVQILTSSTFRELTVLKKVTIVTQMGIMLKKPKKKDPKKSLRKRADKLWSIACFQEWGNRCTVCGKPAVDPHHFFTKSSYGHLRYDINNAVPLCRKCHMRIHFGEDPTINKEIIDIRGNDWYQALKQKAFFEKPQNSYMTVSWYRDNIKRLEENNQ